MKLIRNLKLLSVVGMISLAASTGALADDSYPSKPITIYSPFPAGSATDSILRILAPNLSKQLGQKVLIDIRAGAGGTLAAASMAQIKKADGYQFAAVPTTIFMLPHMQNVPYHPLDDLTYVVNFAEYTIALVVPKSKPWNNVQDFVKASKESKDPITVAIAGSGTPSHSTTVHFTQKTGAKLEIVPFKGGTDVAQAFKGGHVQSVLDGGWPIAMRNGDGKVLVTFTNRRIIPDVPTAQELGYDIVTKSPLGLAAPKDLDPKIAEKIENAFKAAMDSPEFKQALVTYDLQPNFMTGKEYRAVAEELWVTEKKNLEMLGLINKK